MSEKTYSTDINVGFFWIFCIGLLIFGRGCDGAPSSYEHFLNAKYQYQVRDANWEAE